MLFPVFNIDLFDIFLHDKLHFQFSVYDVLYFCAFITGTTTEKEETETDTEAKTDGKSQTVIVIETCVIHGFI